MDLLTFVRFFLSDEYISLLGNWYPRVLAVLAVAVPALSLSFAFLILWLILRGIYGGILGGAKI